MGRAVGRVESVNVGPVRMVEWQGHVFTTAIWKAPADGRVAVLADHVDGDRQADLRVHGGPDKAVYAYAVEDYAWWEEQLGMPLAPGTFGENLTVSGVDTSGAVIGTRWRVGTTQLEVAQPRQPCAKLGLRMGDAAFVDRFRDAARFGAYLRVLEPGDVGVGDVVEVAARSGGVLVRELGAAGERGSVDLFRRVLADPAVPEPWKAWARRGLARAGA